MYEYFELEFFNYTLNCVGKLTVTQLTHENLFLAKYKCLMASKGSKYALFYLKIVYCVLELCKITLYHSKKVIVTQIYDMLPYS